MKRLLDLDTHDFESVQATFFETLSPQAESMNDRPITEARVRICLVARMA